MIKNLILIILGAVFSVQAYAATCEISSDKTPVMYYVNGVLSTSKDTKKATLGMASLLRNTKLKTFRHATNSTRGVYEDIIEAAGQRQAEPMSVTRWLANIKIAPPWFKRKYADSIMRTANVQYENNFDLRNMVEKFLGSLRSGRKVVLVSHSQGNFFANAAYQYIYQNHPEYRRSIGIVAVASPSGRVQDGGVHFRNSRDVVINTVDTFYNVLPSNFSYTSSDLSGHLFNDTYLKARGTAISSSVVNTANRLTTPPLHSSCDPTARAEIRSVFAINIRPTTATIRADLTKGEDVKVWFNYSMFSDQVECRASQAQNAGTFNAVANLSQNIRNLQPQTAYYFRACAVGKDNVVRSGARLNFVTQKLILNCGQTLSTTGGSNGYNAIFNVDSSGTSAVTFQTFTITDRLTIYAGNKVLLETGYVSGLNRYNVVIPWNERSVRIRVIGNNNTSTKWEFSMTCP